MTFEWSKTARGMWEAKSGQLRLKIDFDNGLYYWKAWHGEELLGKGLPRSRPKAMREAEACAEEAMRPKCCLEQGIEAAPSLK